MDLRKPQVMSDIVSNVLLRVENKPESDVKAFLKVAEPRHATGEDLRKAAADHFLSLPLWLIPRMQRVSLIKGVVDTACEGSEFDFDTARILARLRPGLPVHPRRLPAAPAAPAPDAAAPPC